MIRNLVVEHDCVFFCLQAQEITSLLAGGSVRLGDEQMLRSFWPDEMRKIVEGAVCLVGTEAAHPWDDGYDEVRVRLEYMLERLYLARFTALPVPSLTLAAEGTVQSQIDAEYRLMTPPPRAFDPDQFGFLRDPTTVALEALRQSGSFSGLYHVCSCGQDGCHADFALIREGQLLAYIETGSTEVWLARLLPAKGAHLRE